MRTFVLAALCGLSLPVLAQEAKVDITFTADMPSLRDPARHDTFRFTVADAKVVTELALECQAGRTQAFVLRTNEQCSVSGTGQIVNPANPGQPLPRTQYAGGFTVTPNGEVAGQSLRVNYLALGKVPASTEAFSGGMTLKPENPSPGAAELQAALLKKLRGEQTAGAVIDERVDSVQLSKFFIPSAGLPSEKGCTWNGDMIFSYQTESWFINLSARCGERDYALKGNMPWTDTPGVANQTQYDLTFTLPNATLGTDEALFASADGDSDLFATVDGITGQIIMKESAYVKTRVEGKEEDLASQIDGSGQLKGANVSLEAVRSFGILIGILSRTFFGA